MNKDRTDLRELVKHIAPFDELERDTQAWVLDWINSGAPLYRAEAPDVPPTHLVTYGVVIDPVKRSIWLGDHVKSGFWLPPGGHVEVGELVGDSVRRELIEEIGLPAVQALSFASTPLFLSVAHTRGRQSHIDVGLWYIAGGGEGLPVQLDPHDFYGSQWLTFEELAKFDHRRLKPEMGRFMDKLELALGV